MTIKPANSAPPRWLHRLVLMALFATPGAAALVALLIALGAADPPRAAQRIWQAADWRWAGGSTLTLTPGEAGWSTAPVSLPVGTRFTLDVRARLLPGSDPGAAWGVWLAAADGSRIVYALSGEGYITTRRCPPGDRLPVLEDCPAPRPEWRWTPYPRANPAGAANRVELHREAPGQVRLRLNRERLGLSAVEAAGSWGLWWRGGRADSAVLTWEAAALYAD